MMRILIFVILAVLNYTYAEDKTAPEPMQIESELENVNEIPSPDDMMLIWPKIPPSGDPKEVKKAIDIDCEISVILYETPRNFVEYTG